MLAEIFIAIILGCLAGTFTGCTPGIHINLVATLIFASSAALLQIVSPIYVAVFIIAMAITHTWTDALPSIFLGAPDSDTILNVLPGHRMLLQGKGYEAVILTVIGSLLGLIFTIALVPVMIPFLKFFYPLIKNYVGYILLAVVLLLLYRDPKSRVWALIIFLLAGVLGVVVLNMPTLKEPLFPLLSGLFGISSLIISLKDKVKIPKQQISKIELDKKDTVKAISSSVIVGSITSFLPGLGPAQAAIIITQIVRKLSEKGFLILVGSLNTVNMVVSLITLYGIDKARNGAIVIMSKMLKYFDLNHLILLLAVSLIVAGIATLITIKLAKVFSSLVTKINYQKLCLFIIAFVTVLVIILSGPLGLFVLFVSTSVGIIPSLIGVGKNHLMGCLLLPVILFFLL